MTLIETCGLSAPRRTGIMRAAVTLAALGLLSLCAERAAAQQPQKKPDDLDVTMQIIVDPDAKLPDEVVRRIPLPARKPAQTPPADAGKPGQPEGAATGKGSEASEHGRETSEGAKERAREAAEQREAARRAAAEERRREHGPPDHPDPPNRPPRN